jgi:hypothetical protein
MNALAAARYQFSRAVKIEPNATPAEAQIFDCARPPTLSGVRRQASISLLIQKPGSARGLNVASDPDVARSGSLAIECNKERQPAFMPKLFVVHS